LWGGGPRGTKVPTGGGDQNQTNEEKVRSQMLDSSGREEKERKRKEVVGRGKKMVQKRLLFENHVATTKSSGQWGKLGNREQAKSKSLTVGEDPSHGRNVEEKGRKDTNKGRVVADRRGRRGRDNGTTNISRTVKSKEMLSNLIQLREKEQRVV